jgi:hypothetical protein
VSTGLGAKIWIWSGALALVFMVGGALLAEKYPIANRVGGGLAFAVLCGVCLKWWQDGKDKNR